MSPSDPSLTVECLTVDRLSEADREDWEELRRHHPHGVSPLLSPAFAEAIARVRPDVRVLLARREGSLEACLAVHVRPLGLARPIGAPFDDLAGPLTAPGSIVTAKDLVAGAGLGMYRAQNAILPVGRTDEDGEAPYVIDVRGTDGEVYLETRRKAHAKRFKNFRRLTNKLEREVGEVRLEWGRPDPALLRQLLSWKGEQFRRDGLLDIASATHSRAILDGIAALAPADPLEIGGFMVTLHCKGELIAGHFGVRESAHFHPWISAYRPEFAEFAPGMVLLKRVIASMQAMGLETYQLASGHGHYKKYFATPAAPVAELTAIAPGFAGAVHAATRKATRLIGGDGQASAGARLMRRMDHIAACEPGPIARTRELAYAVLRRSRARSPEGHEAAA